MRHIFSSKMLLSILVWNGSSFLFATQTLTDLMSSQQMIQAGRNSFLRRCSGCHGENADGNGPAAKMLSPKPRNLVEGSFKLRSTPYGQLPTVQDLMRTLDQGIANSSMPSFPLVSQQEKLALVAYIRSLRPRFKEDPPERLAITIPTPPKEIFSKKATLLEAAKKGALHFKQACLSCHGESGRGDGPSAPGLFDTSNRPIRPANLRFAEIKSGPTAQDLFKAIATGLDGSPMPGYRETFNDQQLWEIVAYIFYLRGAESNLYPESIP